MLDHAMVLEEVFAAIQRENELREESERIPLSPDARLFGEGGMLTSLGLVSLLLDMEDMVVAQTGRQISLSNERAMASRNNPFRDPRSLADYIVARVEAEAA